MKSFELLLELETFVKQNEDDFDRGKGKTLIEQWIEEMKQNAGVYIGYLEYLNENKIYTTCPRCGADNCVMNKHKEFACQTCNYEWQM